MACIYPRIISHAESKGFHATGLPPSLSQDQATLPASLSLHKLVYLSSKTQFPIYTGPHPHICVLSRQLRRKEAEATT